MTESCLPKTCIIVTILIFYALILGCFLFVSSLQHNCKTEWQRETLPPQDVYHGKPPRLTCSWHVSNYPWKKRGKEKTGQPKKEEKMMFLYLCTQKVKKKKSEKKRKIKTIKRGNQLRSCMPVVAANIFNKILNFVPKYLLSFQLLSLSIT